MPKEKSAPMRMCVACREMKPKKQMLRIVKNKDGEISEENSGEESADSNSSEDEEAEKAPEEEQV